MLYNFPIEELARIIVDPYGRQKDFNEILLEVLKWDQQAFTKSELRLLVQAIDHKWSVSKEFNLDTSLPLCCRFPVLLREFANDVLLYNGDSAPKVIFRNLLRWREISLLISEDTLITPWLAYIEAKSNDDRTRFLWPNILDHDNFRINAILEDELSDTHCHINAATDVFEFNWLRLMTETDQILIESKKNKDYPFWFFGINKEYDRVAHFSERRIPLGEWGLVAAAIRIYLCQRLNGRPTLLSRGKIEALFKENTFNYSLLSDINTDIADALSGALKTPEGVIVDYNIKAEEFKQGISTSPYLIHHGERAFLYRWFNAFFRDREGFRETAGLMLLYLLIKSKIRREFIQTNPLVGFENFQDYDHVKDGYKQKDEKDSTKKAAQKARNQRLREIMFRYAVQTTIGPSGKINLEARMTPQRVSEFMSLDYRRSIFSNENFLKDQKSNVSFIAHFIKGKRKEGERRHHTVRKRLHKDLDKLKAIVITQKGTDVPQLVGIDAAGSELNCRPEVFAPFFRELAAHNLRNFTFHAGEDFFDLVDGLRTIEETISFMGYKTGDRIGHGLALGLNPFEFYEKRHFNLIAPRQILLDNLVWLKFMAAEHDISLHPKTNQLIERHFNQLTHELEFSSSDNKLEILDYYASMRLRGDYRSEVYQDNGRDRLSSFETSLYSPVSPQIKDEKSTISMNLWDHYENSEECRKLGDEVSVIQVSESFAEDVALVQESLVADVEHRGIVIETNPSSNLKIGRFDRFDKHPILRFHQIGEDLKNGVGHSMVVSINTDDKGIFSTSLKNEYSLIAASLYKERDKEGKRKWSELQIENFIRRIAHYGNISRFR